MGGGTSCRAIQPRWREQKGTQVHKGPVVPGLLRPPGFVILTGSGRLLGAPCALGNSHLPRVIRHPDSSGPSNCPTGARENEDGREASPGVGGGGGGGKGSRGCPVTLEPSEWERQALGRHSALINTSDQFSNAPDLIKPKTQFAKRFLPHLNCLDCVESE